MKRFPTICALALGALMLAVPLTSQAQCLMAGLNCTANDLSLHEIIVIGFGADNTCDNTTGDTIDLILQSQVDPPGGGNIYDVVPIISLDGDPIPGNDNPGCYAEQHSPLNNVAPDPTNVPGAGPFRNLDSDLCGDVDGSESG